MLEKEIDIRNSVLTTADRSVTKEIFNVTVAAPDTEQSQTMPSTIVGYLIRVRGGAEIKLSHTATESGTKYVTIPKRATYTDDHTYSNLTIYFQSPVAGNTIEIVTWKV